MKFLALISIVHAQTADWDICAAQDCTEQWVCCDVEMDGETPMK